MDTPGRAGVPCSVYATKGTDREGGAQQRVPDRHDLLRTPTDAPTRPCRMWSRRAAADRVRPNRSPTFSGARTLTVSLDPRPWWEGRAWRRAAARPTRRERRWPPPPSPAAV